MPPDRPPIVLTAAGLVCGLGLSPETAWQAVRAGRRGIGPAGAMESPLPPGSDAGQALGLPAYYRPDAPRESRYLRWAIDHALRSAGLLERLPCPPDRAAVMLGTTLHGMRAGGRFLRSGDAGELRHFLAGDVLADALAGLPLRGGAATTCSACSSSLGSIALAVTLLQSGAADLVIAGGYDPISEYAWAGFNALRLVSGPPLRPFAVGRCGMKVAESYAVVVLERADDARRRGAAPLATVAGWGESADAHHLTQPHPQGAGALTAMRQALGRAGLTAADLDLIAAHATGTPDNDAAEYAALSQLLETRLPAVPVVAFKSHLGHTLGGAGATELILAALALRDQTVPPTVLDPGEAVEFPGLHLHRGPAAPATLRHAMITSLGFGGANTSVVLSAAPDSGHRASPLPVWPGEGRVRASPATHWTVDAVSARQALASQSPHPNPLPAIPGEGTGERHDVTDLVRPAVRPVLVVITGTGLLLPAPGTTMVDPAALDGLINARRVRRMSDYVKLTLAATTLAVRQAGLSSEQLRTSGAVLGTTHGSAGFCRQYYGQVIDEGVTAANPLLFAEGVPNAGAAQLSLMLGLTGACQTVLGTRTAGLDALRLAFLRIASGEADRLIVSAAEEDDPTANAAYDGFGLRGGERGFRNTAGAATLVLESADAAHARGATPLATITHAASASGPAARLAFTTARVLRQLPAAREMVLADSNPTARRRAELAAFRAGIDAPFRNDTPRFGEVFSVTPLAALVSAVAEPRPHNSILLCTDRTGLATAVRLAH